MKNRSSSKPCSGLTQSHPGIRENHSGKLINQAAGPATTGFHARSGKRGRNHAADDNQTQAHQMRNPPHKAAHNHRKQRTEDRASNRAYGAQHHAANVRTF